MLSAGSIGSRAVRIPDAPAGEVRLDRITSLARRRQVDLFTAVPHGHGDGRGLPVCLLLHGGRVRPRHYLRFGIPQQLTAAVRAGAPPFVLAGADGGSRRWEDADGDEPASMITDEFPGWLDERGFDADAIAACGWSSGGYGALRIAERTPGWLRAVAVVSPAVSIGDPVFAHRVDLSATPLAFWSGPDDAAHATGALVAGLARPPERTSYDRARRDAMADWCRVAEEVLGWVGTHLTPPSTDSSRLSQTA